MHTENKTEDESLKNEVKKLRLMLFEERDKWLVERQKRLCIEKWFRQHLQQCRSKIGEVALETSYSNAAVQTDNYFLCDASLSSVALGHDGSFFSNLPTRTHPHRLFESFSDSSGDEHSSYSSRSFNNNVDEVFKDDKSYSSTKDAEVIRPAFDGLYFIDMNGRINHESSVNSKAAARMRNFVQRSVARQLRIKAASKLRQKAALEKSAVISKLISGETGAEDALPLFRAPPVSAFSKKLIRGETKARFQRTLEYRKNEDAQLDLMRKKWNRLHALCFSEALRLRSFPENVINESICQSTVRRNTRKSPVVLS